MDSCYNSVSFSGKTVPHVEKYMDFGASKIVISPDTFVLCGTDMYNLSGHFCVDKKITSSVGNVSDTCIIINIFGELFLKCYGILIKWSVGIWPPWWVAWFFHEHLGDIQKSFSCLCSSCFLYTHVADYLEEWTICKCCTRFAIIILTTLGIIIFHILQIFSEN